MNLITREELKARLDRDDDFKLVMVLGEWHFRAKHITGSINLSSPSQASELGLSKNEDIVVYCSSESCPASGFAYGLMLKKGYTNVRRYVGGISDWEHANYPMEGELV